MKRKKKKNEHQVSKNGEEKKILLRRIAIGVCLVAVGAAAYFLSNTFQSLPKETHPTKAADDEVNLTTDELFKLTVQRAYAIDVLFKQVYNSAWEAANGAIGEAFLYAATGDQSLLNIYTRERKFSDMMNGTWVDDRAWVCLAELYWWEFSGKQHDDWVADARKRYDEARKEGRLSNHEGFWSWYSWPPDSKVDDMIISNSNTNQMVTVACMLYEATKDKRYYNDALLVWNGDKKYPGIEKMFYRGNGVWEGKGGRAAFGKQLPWESASYLSVIAALYRMTGDAKFKDIAIASARRIMDPANGWVDPTDYYQLRMDGNGAFVHFILDAYLIAPDSLSDIPKKVGRMLQHVWSNNHGAAYVLLHRLSDNAIRNGWNPRGGEEGYGVDQIGTVHAQSQAMRAFGVYAYVLHEELKKR
ncbi:MAG TPA: hypothetical protein VMM58_03800 [Bacteroidota bacterium]|nr:hypothetical protein [Bacteroidota bacterium]